MLCITCLAHGKSGQEHDLTTGQCMYNAYPDRKVNASYRLLLIQFCGVEDSLLRKEGPTSTYLAKKMKRKKRNLYKVVVRL